MDPILLKFKQKFFDEAARLIDGIEKSLLDLEELSDKTMVIEEIFRVMHTLKGVSGMYGFMKISEITHKLESVYDLIRENKLEISTTIVDITLSSVDHIKNLLADEDFQNLQNQNTHNIILVEIDKIQQKKQVPAKKSRKAKINKTDKLPKLLKSYYIMLQPDEKLIDDGINILDIFRELSNLGTYRIVNHAFSGFPGIDNENQTAWGIYLTSVEELEEIENVFLFINDFVKIIKISDKDIFSESVLPQNITEETEEDGFGFFVPLDEFLQPDNLIEETKQQADTELTEETENAEPLLLPDIDLPKTDSTVVLVNEQTKQSQSRISVDSGKLDDLMNLVSELVTTNAQLSMANKLKNQILLESAIERVEKLVKQFRENALSLRLVPVDDIVVRFRRLIRDLSHQLGKEVRFVTEGTDTELDKNIIDHLVDPIMHIIRNSLDHGIEKPEIRKKQGKPAEGTILFSAYYSGANIFLKISDDGNGIDYKRVQQKAIEKGLIHTDQHLTEKEIIDLIFLPGFSTAESLTQVSGRGVGMDVVKRKIAEIRGHVQVESLSGKGTTFTIKLQQTVSIIDTLLIKTENTHFMLPLSEVEVCDQQLHSEIFQNQNKLVKFNNSLVPFIHLRSEFALGQVNPKSEKIIIINKNNKRVAIVADKIIGEQQAVLKPLGKILKNQEYILGASVMGTGEMALMLDTEKLAEKIFTENNN